ncbi:DUF3429 domain-containing protein [Falsiroseomonas sp. CW058]|uniref:DUF3429 domain-containing protein n=1 Tax=Falsiroseomonas sp. CW058 TaxID=3388664 RepID=UPI003D312749
MDATLSPSARWLGPAGLIPFVALAAGAWLGARGAAPALAAYGATILAFLGAVHWGLAMRAPPAERRADLPRLGLGVVPALVAWVALLLPTAQALALLAAAILATALVETVGARSGLVPRDYLRLRWALSCAAAACLLAGAAAARLGL